ncbi:Hint domain-containing protein [Loktanella fryxellensis]|uniref:Hint domain-containing protein n=1 Tax=Loktanella fryxellensis TaxID=245187 RepID=A0A1H8B2L1_9RHOB|nr:Hint domain-containing protein [Loktanella fryxellensis]SEM76993.1 Hint domain-containing protein [Loktanella fryxellensis]
MTDVGGGFTTDQLDTSDLRTPDGSSVTAFDVTVVNDNGSAKLIFPSGEAIILKNVAPGDMATAGQRYRAGIPCFTPGTEILTPSGPRSIDTLCPGDVVVTRDNGPQPIVWIGRRTLTGHDLVARPQLRPIKIEAGAIGNSRPLLVSPQHGVLICQGNRDEETLIRATQLERMKGGRVRTARGIRHVAYIHLMFDRHQIIRSNDIWTESFYPGLHALAILQGAELSELMTLFPALKDSVLAAIGPQTRLFAKAKEIFGPAMAA